MRNCLRWRGVSRLTTWRCKDKLLIPGDAGNEVVLPVTGGSPGASTDEHSPEPEAEASRAVQIVQRHQVMLGELPQPIEVEPELGEQQKHQDC